LQRTAVKIKMNRESIGKGYGRFNVCIYMNIPGVEKWNRKRIL